MELPGSQGVPSTDETPRPHRELDQTLASGFRLGCFWAQLDLEGPKLSDSVVSPVYPANPTCPSPGPA